MTLSLVIFLSSHKGPRGGIVIPSLLGKLVSALDTNTVPASLPGVLSPTAICRLSSWLPGSSLCLRQVALKAHTGHRRNADQDPRSFPVVLGLGNFSLEGYSVLRRKTPSGHVVQSVRDPRRGGLVQDVHERLPPPRSQPLVQHSFRSGLDNIKSGRWWLLWLPEYRQMADGKPTPLIH